MKKKIKWILAGLVGIIAVVTVFIQVGGALTVKALEVQPREIARSFAEEGFVVPANEIVVSAPGGGRITAIPVQEGDRVLTGDLLLVLDSSSLNFELDSLEGQLRSMQAQWEVEKSAVGLEKLKQLYEAGAISQKEYEDARNKVESDYYPGQLAALEARIAAVHHQIEENSVKAALEGIISELTATQGAVVTPGAPLMNIFRENEYLVETYVLTEDVARLSLGDLVELIQKNKAGDLAFPGVVESIAPSAVPKTSALGLSEQRVKVGIKPQIPEGLVLRPGYNLEIKFILDRQTERLVVPRTAIFPYQGGQGVWVIEDGKARVKAVKTGFMNEKEIVIEEGLGAGEMVLLDPQQTGLKEGVKVRQ